MTKRSIYPIYYKWAFSKGREKEFIPLEERKKIPKQTKWSWRNLNADEIKHLDNNPHLKRALLNLYGIKSSEVNIYKQYLYAASRFQFSTINMIGEDKYQNLLDKNKDLIVGYVERYKKHIDKEVMLKWLHVSNRRYAYWQSQVRYKCTSSITSLCAKKYYNQTTPSEFNKIENSLNDSQYSHWPKCAIHGFLLKNNNLILSRSTFYKYASQIKPGAQKKNYKKKRKILRVERPNELWHFDISYFRTLDGKKHYIYAIIDNYSRKIIKYDVKTRIRNKYMSNLLLKALGVHQPKDLKLLSDGGPENTGRHVREVLRDYKRIFGNKVEHMVALKVIDYTNNMIERFFRIMKSNYLYLTEVENGLILRRLVDKLIYEYNFIRPHYVHGLLTPHEAYIGKEKPQLKERFIYAKRVRVYKNKNCKCKVCTCNTNLNIRNFNKLNSLKNKKRSVPTDPSLGKPE